MGLGYANLGALLMSLGLPYDSNEGRAWAGALTAVMTGHAYATSARIAARIGPFNGYERNREPMLRVIAKHGAAVKSIEVTGSSSLAGLRDAAREDWDEALALGRGVLATAIPRLL